MKKHKENYRPLLSERSANETFHFFQQDGLQTDRSIFLYFYYYIRPTSCTYHGWVLQLACNFGYVQIVKDMLEKGVSYKDRVQTFVSMKHSEILVVMYPYMHFDRDDFLYHFIDTIFRGDVTLFCLFAADLNKYGKCLFERRMDRGVVRLDVMFAKCPWYSICNPDPRMIDALIFHNVKERNKND